MKTEADNEVVIKKEREKNIKQILKSYKNDMTQAEALAALDSLTNYLKYDDGLCKVAKKFLRVIENAQDINEFQALIFSAIFCVYPINGVLNSHIIGQLFGKSHLWVLQSSDQIDELVEKKLLFKVYDNNSFLNSYGIRKEVFDAVMKNEKYVRKPNIKNSTETFLSEFMILVQRFSEEQNFEDYKENVLLLLNDNSSLSFVKKIVGTFTINNNYISNMSFFNMTMFLYMCASAILDNFEIAIYNLVSIGCLKSAKEEIMIKFGKNTMNIQQKKLIEFCCAEGIVDKRYVKLTDKALKKFLPGIKNTGESTKTSFISCLNIPEKKLFFSDEFKKNVSNLTELLKEEKFKCIQERLKSKNQNIGFAALFYGAPGTGKTELAMQLAKETERDILQVNISDIKSKWVGESEKNIQQIFDNYNKLCEGAKKIPILLFNESDAIINKRLNNINHSVDIMNNAMQNIILQAFETQTGIIICTSNLVDQNLDPAFERRFLYKLKFPETTPEVRAKIWMYKIPELSEKDALAISTMFNLSGGQIDNVVRRWNIDEILYGASINDFNKLVELCKSESLEKMNNKKIGFAI